MPGRPHHVGAQDFARVEGGVERGVGRPSPSGGNVADALGQRPFRAGVVLRLHRPQPADHLGGGLETRLGQPLIVESSLDDIKVHWESFWSTKENYPQITQMTQIRKKQSVKSVQPVDQFFFSSA